jgi:hypothetical protein
MVSVSAMISTSVACIVADVRCMRHVQTRLVLARARAISDTLAMARSVKILMSVAKTIHALPMPSVATLKARFIASVRLAGLAYRSGALGHVNL